MLKTLKRKIRRYGKKIRSIIKENGLGFGCQIIIHKAMYFFGYKYINRVKNNKNNLKQYRLLFDSRPEFSDNARVLFDHMLANGYNKRYQLVWLVTDRKQYAEYDHIKNVKFIDRFVPQKYFPKDRKYSIKAFYYAYTSKYCIFTHAMRWPGRLNGYEKPGQIYLDLWHGCGFKGTRDNDQPNEFDYCLVPGPLFIKSKSEFFHCSSDKIIPIGYPRYDLFRQNQDKVRESFDRLYPDAVKKIVWMPTFRDSSQLFEYEDPLPFIIGLPMVHNKNEFLELDHICRKYHVVLIIKWHRNSGNIVNLQRLAENIIFVTDEDIKKEGLQLYEWLAGTDALITDYSSVSVDYLLLDKPIGYAISDYDDYERSRGFVISNAKDYMPGHHILDFSDMETFIKDVVNNNDIYRKDRKKLIPVMQNPTDQYCRRILDYFKISM